jgi:hypothetical protein
MDSNRYSGDDFNDFLKELVRNNRLNDTKEEGIVKLVVDKGVEALSEKQKFVFEKAISYYVYKECKRCGCEIPWCEMSAAEDNGRLCSWCAQVGTKDN